MTELTGIFYNYTMAEIAQLLGMNYNSTDKILYKGSNSSNGIRISGYNSSSTAGNLRVNNTDVYQSSFISGRNLKYQLIDGGGIAFSFANDRGILDLIVTRYKNTYDDTYGDCYVLQSQNNMYVIFDDDTDSAISWHPSGISLSSPRRRSPVTNSSYTDSINTNVVSLAPLIVPMSSTNARIIQGVYLPTEFPALRSGYTEFSLNGDLYIALSYTSSTNSNASFIIKEAVSA